MKYLRHLKRYENRFYTVDRLNSLSEKQIISLNTSTSFDSVYPGIFNQYPEGLSQHGIRYLIEEKNLDVNFYLELIFEYIRQKNFPDKLSRFQSLFAFKKISEAVKFNETFGNDKSDIWIIESDNSLKLDMNLMNTPHQCLELFNNAYTYWDEHSTSDPIWECLIKPPIKVLEKYTYRK